MTDVTAVAALLESKYRVPGRRPGAVARPRLAEGLDAARRSSLTLVSAPAGFGKTTALTEWLASVDRDGTRVAWLSLDHRDNDPVLFWTYVIRAISAAVDGVGAGALSLLTASSSSTEAALAALVNDLDALPTDLMLVLDDYHLVEAPDVHDGLWFLLDHQPATLHVILATRADPPLPLAKLRAGGRLAEVRAAELRFTSAESEAYLNGPMGLALSAADIATLNGRTEGWIAALQLAALSMQGRDDVSGFIAGFAGDDRHIVDYLAEEVLARQSPDVREFLLRTSVLERLTGPLCDAVTRRDDGRSQLVALDRANLFLVALDDRRRWYRYHHLFADVLQGHLHDELPGEAPTLHRRASAWFADHGDISQAVVHALAAGDVDQAADLMETAMPVLTRERREAELRSWVRALPEQVVRARPVLGVAFVGVLAQASDFGAVALRLAEIERTLRPEGGPWPDTPPTGVIVVDDAAYRSLPARVEMYRAALSLADGDLPGTIAHATEALSAAPAADGLTRAAAGALAGLAAWAGGDLSRAHAAYTESIGGLRSAGFVADVLGCCITLGDIRCVQGRLEDAMGHYRWALELAAEASATPLRGSADMHVGMAGVLLERNDLAAAAQHLATSAQLGEPNGLPQNPYRWRVVTARLREAQGDLDAALQLLEDAVRVYAGDYSPNVRPVPAVLARLRLRRGERHHAEAWARERGLSAGDEPAYLKEYEHLTLARVLLARHQTERDGTSLAEALSLLERLRESAERGERVGSLIEVLILTSLARQLEDAVPAALETLRSRSGARRARGLRAPLRRRGAADDGPAQGAGAQRHREALRAATAGRHRLGTGREHSQRRAGRGPQRPRARRAAAARQRPQWAGHRAAALRLAEHPSYAYQEHLHEARRHQPPLRRHPGARPPADFRRSPPLTQQRSPVAITTCGDDRSPRRPPESHHSHRPPQIADWPAGPRQGGDHHERRPDRRERLDAAAGALRAPGQGTSGPALGRLVRRDDPHRPTRRHHPPRRAGHRSVRAARRTAPPQRPRPHPRLGHLDGDDTQQRRPNTTGKPSKELDMTAHTQAIQQSTPAAPVPIRGMDPMRRTALTAGVLYLITFVSIPTLFLYQPVKTSVATFILGAGSDTGVVWGAASEIIVGLAGIATAVVLYPVTKRVSQTAALGLVTARLLETSLIFVSVIHLLSILSLRNGVAAGTSADSSALVTVGQSLVAGYNSTFLVSQSLMPVVCDLLLGYLLYRSRLVPRILPIIAFVGAPLLLASDIAVFIGVVPQVSAISALAALPVAVFEFSLGVRLIVKGFDRSALTALDAHA